MAISRGKGIHSTKQWRCCCAKPMTVSRNTTSFSCSANIIIRHFLKLRISSQTWSSTVLVAGTCCWHRLTLESKSFIGNQLKYGKKEAASRQSLVTQPFSSYSNPSKSDLQIFPDNQHKPSTNHDKNIYLHFLFPLSISIYEVTIYPIFHIHFSVINLIFFFPILFWGIMELEKESWQFHHK